MGNSKDIKDFSDLDVYKLSLDLANFVYDITREFPKEETYGIISQIRRASLSVGANIAEGHGRYYYKETIQYLRQARASLCEVHHFMIFSKSRGYIGDDYLDKFYELFYPKLKVKINNFINSLQKLLDNK